MTLVTQVHAELNRLDALGVATSGGASFGLDVGSGRLEAQLTGLDQIGCSFEHFALRTDRLDNATVDQLKSIADQLSGKLGYLLEKISPIEIDDEACVVQMRSNPPERDDDGTRYYELVARRGELSLARYAKTLGHPRRVVPAHVTREVFSRLAKDFVAVIP